MQSEEERELRQLWFVSKMYFEKAQSIEVPKKDLQLTVKRFADICKEDKGLRNHRDLICASAHLDSCAVRLYAIDECIDSERYKNYKKIRECKNEKNIRFFFESIEHYIHFLIRHMVAHCESKRLDFPKYRAAYNVMYDIYLDLQYCFVFEKLEKTMELIKGDINID